MKGDKEIVGTLRGFDVYVNMVLEDVVEIEITPEVSEKMPCDPTTCPTMPSDQLSFHQGKKITKLEQILLNGNNIALIVPGGHPDGI